MKLDGTGITKTKKSRDLIITSNGDIGHRLGLHFWTWRK